VFFLGQKSAEKIETFEHSAPNAAALCGAALHAAPQSIDYCRKKY
jgi:hypothetical protein